jgi:hypothetical protein
MESEKTLHSALQSRLTERWYHFNIHVHFTAHALDSSHEPLFEVLPLCYVASVFAGEDFCMILAIPDLVVRTRKDYGISAQIHIHLNSAAS